MKRLLLLTNILVVLFIFAACGAKDDENKESQSAPSDIKISDEEKLAEDAVVAVVNGNEIKGVTYNLVYTQLKLYALQMGQDISDEEIKESTIESLIDRELLMQQAHENGIVVTEEEAQSEIDRLKENNKEAFEVILEQYQITEESFVDQLKFEMTMNQFVTEEIEVTVTDDEVQKYYEQIKEEQEEVPEFADIKEAIKRRIEAEKRDEQLQATIEKLKENSEIEIHI